MARAWKYALCVFLCSAAGFAQVPDGNWWKVHFTSDLLPFWDNANALGDPTGAFASVRCNDRSTLDFNNPCPEANNGYLMAHQRYLVSESRQTYGYGVAFHLTGDPKYLDYMKAGIDYIRANAIDWRNGGMATQQNLDDGTWGPAPAFRNPQELGYGLLGMAFYYYLTRDPEVLPDLIAIKRYIIQSYYNDRIGTMQWLLASTDTDRYDDKHLVATLDQMNTYLVLLSPILPEPYQTEWKATARQLAYSIINTYYSSKDNMMFLSATTPSDLDINVSTPDFGHTSKAMWMIRYTGLLTGDDYLVKFAETNAPRHLQRSFIQSCGCWGGGVVAGGGMDPNKSWWVYAELDQLAGTLAINGLPTANYLATAPAYWREYFVDHQYGEVWTSIDASTNRPPAGDNPKQWPWKNAYHSLEHAMVGYITGSQLNNQPVTLYYAFVNPAGAGTIRPYYFTGTITDFEPVPLYYSWPVYKLTFTDVK